MGTVETIICVILLVCIVKLIFGETSQQKRRTIERNAACKNMIKNGDGKDALEYTKKYGGDYLR